MQKYELNKEKSYLQGNKKERYIQVVEEKSRARRLLRRVRLFKRTNAKSTVCVCVCVRVCVCVCMLSHIQFFAVPWSIANQASLFMEFSRQEYWSGYTFPSPGDLLNPGTEPVSLVSPALASGFLTTVPSKSSPWFCSRVYGSALAIRTARVCIWDAGFTILIADFKTNLTIFVIIHSHNVPTSKTEPF